MYLELVPVTELTVVIKTGRVQRSVRHHEHRVFITGRHRRDRLRRRPVLKPEPTGQKRGADCPARIQPDHTCILLSTERRNDCLYIATMPDILPDDYGLIGQVVERSEDTTSL